MNSFYGHEFDFKYKNSTDKLIKLNMVVCFHFVPRSGSNFLSDLIWQTQCLGFPLEYFSPQNYKKLKNRLGNFNNLVRIRTSPNGIFSYKWNSNFDIMDPNQKIFNILRPKHHFFIDRKDRELQALSFAKAKKTNSWINFIDSYQELSAYVNSHDVKTAENLLNAIRTQSIISLEKKSIEPIYIYYEDLVNDPKFLIKNIFEKISLPVPSDIPTKSIFIDKSR